MRPACARFLGLVFLVCCAMAEINWWLVVVAKQTPKRHLRAAHQVRRLQAWMAIRQGLHLRSVTLELALMRGAGW